MQCTLAVLQCKGSVLSVALPGDESSLMTLFGTMGVLLIGLRMRIAGVLAAVTKDLANTDGIDGMGRNGETVAAAAGAGAGACLL